MLTLTGPASSYCDGVTRRDFVRVGALTLGGLTLPSFLRYQAAAAESSGETPRKTAVISIELDGGPSQFETYDPKPEAPLEFRGSFSPIRTNVSGVYFSELMAEQAKVMDKMAVVRSITHESNEHSNAGQLICTGHYRRDGGAGPQEMPGIGAVASRVRGQNAFGIPAYVALLGQMRGGRAMYLGARHDPFTIDQDPNAANFKVENLAYGPGVNFDRLRDRQQLLTSLDSQRRLADVSATAGAMDEYTHEAYEMIASGRAAQAFDIASEPSAVRDRYGRTHIGQAILLARRLIEADVTFVSVRDREWDDHANIAERMRKLRPRFDKAIAALIGELYARGLDQHVLLIAMVEFGRTPRIGSAAGRDHWAPVMSAVISGGGLRVGQVVGSSTSRGEMPKDSPYRPENMLAMVYRHLGIDPALTFPDFEGRPRYLLEHREFIHELI